MNRINPYNIVVVIAAVICAVFLFNVARDLLHDRTLERVISSELAADKVPVGGKDLVGKVKHVYLEKRYWVSDSFSFDDFEKRLAKSLDRAGFKLLSVSKAIREAKTESREEISFLIAERPLGSPIFRLTLIHRTAARPVPARPKLAIVLDDWGYNTNNLDAILRIDKPVTLSVLPGLPYSTLISRKAQDHGHEVILHMPMEPKAKIRLEIATLYTGMTDDEIRANFYKAIQTVPGAAGMSNHEGSKATEDRRLIRVVFGELKKNNMFFLDSLVTNYSVCESAAKEAGIRFIKRSIFLDNESVPAYIKKQFEKAIEIALKSGAAVAIGHDRPNTIAVLKEMIPAIEAKGIEITFVSNLAR